MVINLNCLKEKQHLDMEKNMILLKGLKKVQLQSIIKLNHNLIIIKVLEFLLEVIDKCHQIIHI